MVHIVFLVIGSAIIEDKNEDDLLAARPRGEIIGLQ